MIRSIVVHDIPADAVAAMERWYHRVHAPEIARRSGRGLRPVRLAATSSSSSSH